MSTVKNVKKIAFKCACGGMVLVTAAGVWLHGHHQGCKATMQICVAAGQPPEQQDGPENDNHPFGGGLRGAPMAATSTASTTNSGLESVLRAIAGQFKPLT
jgi:hypothetical protein